MHRGSFTGDSEEGETLSGDLVCGGHREICKRKLWKRASLSIGASLGNLREGGSITGEFVRRTNEGSGNGASISKGALREEPGGRAPLLGTLQDMERKALETGVSLHRAPLGDHARDAALLGTLRETGDFVASGDLVY